MDETGKKYYDEFMSEMDRISELKSHSEKMELFAKMYTHFTKAYNDGHAKGIEKGKKMAFNIIKKN